MFVRIDGTDGEKPHYLHRQFFDLDKAPDNLLHSFYCWRNSDHIVPINIFSSMHFWRVVQDVGEAFFLLSANS